MNPNENPNNHSADNASPAPEPQNAAPSAAPKPAAFDISKINTLLADFVGRLIGLATRALSPKMIRCSLSCSRDAGQYAVLAGIVLTLVYAIVAAVRYKSFDAFATGLGIAIGLVIAQYAASRFMASSERILASTPNRISSKAFLDCAGLLLLLAALGLFIGGIYTAIRVSSAAPLVSAIVIAPLLMLAGAIALNPDVVGVEIKESSAGEEAVGIMSFCLKIWVKIVPPLFCLLALAGCVITVWSWFDAKMAAFSLSGFAQFGGVKLLPFLDAFMIRGMAGPSLVLYACMTPVIVYLLFIFWSLALDLARAILAIPGKLDSLKRN